jgi:hypothetical protein
MAKRFTDTDKWKDEWFTDLEPAMKILWIYICDNCDHAGVWKVNFKLATNTIGGCLLDKQSALNAFGKRIRLIAEDKWFIEKFISFQYPKGLSESCKAHQGVLKVLKLNKIDANPYLTLINGYANSMATVQDKDKDKDKDSSLSLNPKSNVCARKVNSDFLIQKWNDEVNGIGRLSFCHGLSGQALSELVTTTSFENFQKVESWENVFSNIKKSEFLNGSRGSFVATLNWVAKHENALKVLNGQYSGAPDDQNQPKAGFKTKSNGLATTPENPTGSPYLQEAIDKGLTA